MSDRRLLIDGDLILYRTGFAIERTKYLVELQNTSGYKEFSEFEAKKDADKYIKNTTTGVDAQSVLWSRKNLEPVEHGYAIIDSMFKSLCGKYDCPYSLFISGPTNFRDRVWKTKKYKGNRDSQQRPTHYDALKDYLVTLYGATITDGIEADDAIGIASTPDTVCVSLDKDLDQIPGFHYNWVEDLEYVVTPKDAKTQFYIQLLAGDATDNIQGIPGIGVVKAAKALAECQNPKEMMEVAVQMYKEEFGDGWLGCIEETAQLVYILRSNDLAKWFGTKDYAYLKEIWDRGVDAQAA